MLVLVLTAIAVLAATLGLESDNADGAKPLSLLASAPVTGFGGYTLQSDVDSIEAQWQVPKVLDTSKSGWAATWIGAQAPTGVDSFIQLGIIEESYSYAGSAIELQRPPGVSRYLVFWSDTKHLFQPVILGTVPAGSVVTASMKSSSGGWLLAIQDGSKWLAHDLVVPSSAGAKFNRAEWIQEDPPVTRIASSDSPYPKLSIITFQNMMLNGRVPDLPYSDAQALSTGNGTFEKPTHMRGGSFALEPVTGSSAQYLADATTFDADATAYEIDWKNWRNESPMTRISGVKKLIEALRTSIASFQSQSWPTGTVSSVDALIGASRRQEEYLTHWIAAGDTSVPPSFPRRDVTTPYADRIRASLGLPRV